MSLDRLDGLLRRFRVSAHMFHSGALCGINDFQPQAGLGQLHLVQRGPLRIEHAASRPITVKQPSLLFYPRPLLHRFVSDRKTGADMTCAHVRFADGEHNPLAQALPACVVMPLDELSDTRSILDALFDEAFAQRCGRQAVVDRLFEVVLIRILRRLLDAGSVDGGLLAGMAHPQLVRALVAMHDDPRHAWSLETLARRAGMSRSAFAQTFRRVIGLTPGDYLAGWRLGLAQQLLRQGQPLKLIVDEVGYGSVAALSRAFSVRLGQSPRAWKAAQAPANDPPALPSGRARGRRGARQTQR
jgi:AraC-like DNA-binding protein